MLAAGIGVCALCAATPMTASWSADFGIAPVGVLLLILAILGQVLRGVRLGFVLAKTSCRVPWRLGPDLKLPRSRSCGATPSSTRCSRTTDRTS